MTYLKKVLNKQFVSVLLGPIISNFLVEDCAQQGSGSSSGGLMLTFKSTARKWLTSTRKCSISSLTML